MAEECADVTRTGFCRERPLPALQRGAYAPLYFFFVPCYNILCIFVYKFIEKGIYAKPMQHFKNFDWKKFLMQGVLPCLLAVAVGFISRYQLELSDGVTESFLALQWPLYAPLNALTAFCLTLILFAMLGRWWLSTALSGAVFTIIALINYYTRDLHGSALMPQDILNLGTAAEVMGSYTLKITHDVIKIALLFLPILAIAFVQRRLCKGAPKRASWPARGVRVAGSALCVFLVMFFGYFGPVTVKPKTTYGWAWQNTYYTYGYLAGTIEATSLMADPIIEPENYNDAAAVNFARKADDYAAPASPESAEDYPDIVLILSESFYDFDLVTDLQADTDIMPVTKNLTNAVYGHTISPHVGGGTNSTEYEMLTSNSLILMPSITPFNWLNLYNANSVVSYLKGLGYSTMAAHPYTNSNYRRDSAWLALGFDETHFESDFPTKETYGDRPYQTDSATYRDWEKMYEAMPEDKPRFSFLVSIQSHGDYDMNDASLDIVHAGTDYGEYDELMDEYGYEAVFVGSGAGLPRFMGIPGESLKGVYSANEFLTRSNLMKAYLPTSKTPIRTGKKVAVVGGGNVAMDAARSALRLGAETVYIVYRRGMAELPARKEEVEHAEEEGIIFKTLCNPVEIHANDEGFVKSITCIEMELGEPDASGRRRPIEKKGSEFELDVDTVIMSLGTSPNPLIRSTTPGLETNKHGCIVTEGDEGKTSREGVYAGGDAVTGAATVIKAMGAGKAAAKAMDEYIQNK